jgi:hypothetical protein
MRSLMRRSLLAATVLGLLFGAAGRAVADPVTFQASGTFQSGVTLGGTLTIDTKLGNVTGADLTLSAPESAEFTIVENSSLLLSDWDIQVGNGASGNPIVEPDPPVTTLVGYSGGPLSRLGDAFPLSNSFFTPSDQSLSLR